MRLERIAKQLHYTKGFTISRSIAVAVNTVKRWSRGQGGVTAATQAKAAKAYAQWLALRAKAKASRK